MRISDWSSDVCSSDLVLTEESPWLGGQVTNQAVPMDEHPWMEKTPPSRHYRRFRNNIRDQYTHNFDLSDGARADRILNPGGGGVSPICAEPRLAVAAIERSE